MLGRVSVALHSMIFAELFSLLHFALAWELAAAAALATAVAFVLAVSCGSVPVFFFLRWVNARHERRAAAADAAPLVVAADEAVAAEADTDTVTVRGDSSAVPLSELDSAASVAGAVLKSTDSLVSNLVSPAPISAS